MGQRRFFHAAYCAYQDGRGIYLYTNIPIIRLSVQSFYGDRRNEPGIVEILCRDKSRYSWKSKYADQVFTDQVGIAVRNDGGAVILQTWDRGTHCLDAKTGEQIWWKRYGATNIFMMENSLLCKRPYKSLQLLDVHTGQLLQERRGASWGFMPLNQGYIICKTKGNGQEDQWEIIRAATLETVQTMSYRELTNDESGRWVVSNVVLTGPGELRVSGFTGRNVYSVATGSQPERFSVVVPCTDLSA